MCMALLYATFNSTRMHDELTYFKQKNGLKCSNLGQKRGEKNRLLLNRCY